MPITFLLNLLYSFTSPFIHFKSLHLVFHHYPTFPSHTTHLNMFSNPYTHSKPLNSFPPIITLSHCAHYPFLTLIAYFQPFQPIFSPYHSPFSLYLQFQTFICISEPHYFLSSLPTDFWLIFPISTLSLLLKSFTTCLNAFTTTVNHLRPLRRVSGSTHTCSSSHINPPPPHPRLRIFDIYHVFSCVSNYFQLLASPNTYSYTSTTIPSHSCDPTFISEPIYPSLTPYSHFQPFPCFLNHFSQCSCKVPFQTGAQITKKPF